MERTLEIWTFVFKFAFKYLLLSQKWTYGRQGMTPKRISERKKRLAIWLREGLVRLGPTFIKIGQQFSTRVDVLAPEFIKELEKLQDNVPPFETQYAKQLIQKELGKSVEELFDEFEDRPVAAASLGQVHICKLNGQKVVCKVQRPGLRDLFAIDLKNIRKIAEWLNKADPKTDGAARDWVAIYDECAKILYEEIDYRLEAANAAEFAKNFEGIEWIKVPKVYEQYSTQEVLVMEYVPGVKVNNAAAIDQMGLDRQRLARLTVESYLQQLLKYGFFHADPHPGNVAVDAENGGRLIYYDFGMMGRIPNKVREGLFDLFYGVYDKNPDRCLDALQQMGVFVGTGDRTAIRRTASFFLEQFEVRLQEQRQQRKMNQEEYQANFKPQLTKEEKKAKRKKILSNIGEDILVAAADQPFRFPATFTFVVRAFTVLDGIGKSLDPRFDISEISAPYARDFLLEATPVFDRVSQDLIRRSENQNRAVVNLFKGPNRLEYIGNTLERMERGDLKLRVRALEAERALARVQQWQRLMGALLASCTFANVGTVLYVSTLGLGATMSFVAAGLCGLMALINLFKVKKLEKQEKSFTGAA